jgi:iron complex outermembrane receptor protein
MLRSIFSNRSRVRWGGQTRYTYFLMAVVLCGISVAHAQQRMIPTVYVTAQKEEQRLQDVNISMTVLDEVFIEQQHIGSLEDLGVYVPSARFSFEGNSSNNDIRLRGFGSTIVNRAFEQPAGLVVDGVPFNRLPYFFSTLFDLQRIEVLRGPQGTLFGKNTTAGAINVTTRNPSDEFTANVNIEIGERDRRHIDLGIGGPLIKDVVNFRIAGVSHETRGYMENTSAGLECCPRAERWGPAKDRKGARVKLQFLDILGAEALLTYARITSDSRGDANEERIIEPIFAAYQAQYDPNFDAIPHNELTSDDIADVARIDVQTFGLQLTRDFGDYEATLIAQRDTLKYFQNNNNPTPGPELEGLSGDFNPQNTVEFRVQSPDYDGLFGLIGLGQSNFLAGVFYQHRGLEVRSTTLRHSRGFINTLISGGSLPFPAFVPPAVPDVLNLDDGRIVQFDQTAETIAGFAHFMWDVTDRTTLEYGMRLTQEKKDGFWDLSVGPGPSPLSLGSIGGAPFTEQRSISNFVFTPKIALSHDITPDIRGYAFWARGFKSAGLNEFQLSPDPESFTYEKEIANDFEVGTKMTLLDGQANLNVGLFWQEATDLQVLQVIVDPPRVLGVNAGKARSRGVEIDGTWLATDWLTIVAALGYIDAKFIDYKLGGCAADRPDTDGSGDRHCDLSGLSIDRTPKWTVTVVPSVTFPLASLIPFSDAAPDWLRELDLQHSLVVEYQDVHTTSAQLDPRTRQPAFMRVGGTLGFASPQGWSVGITGQNLTNEDVMTYSADLFAGGNLWQSSTPPRTVFGWVRLAI